MASAPSKWRPRPSPSSDGLFSKAPLRDEARRALRSFIVRRRRSRTGPSSSGRPDDDTAVSTDGGNDNSGDDEAEVAEEDDDVVEVCRVLQREASLLYHTERVREALRQDPFEVLRDDADPGGDDDDDDDDVKTPQRRSRKSKGRDGQIFSVGEHDFRPGRRRRQLLQPMFRTAQVTDFDQVVTRDGYVRTEATVRLHRAASFHRPAPINGGRRQAGRCAASHHKTKGRGAGGTRPASASKDENWCFVELRFCYERTANGTDRGPSSMGSFSVPTYVSYQIEYCGSGRGGGIGKGDNDAAIVGPRQRLLWVNAVAPWGTPSPHGAQLVSDDVEGDEGLGSDLESDRGRGEEGGTNREARAPSPEPKRRKRSRSAGGDRQRGDDPFETPEDSDVLVEEDSGSDLGGDETATMKDRFAAGVDTDVLHEFLEDAGLDDPVLANDEGAALYVLLSFPFYEHEWDLVGFLLEAAFGPDDSDEEEDEEDEGDGVGDGDGDGDSDHDSASPSR